MFVNSDIFDRFTEQSSRQREFGRCQPGTYAFAGRKEINLFHQLGAHMVALKKQPDLNEISTNPDKSSRPPMVKFRIFGEEMIEKEVKASGNSGRIYLPLDWVGKHIKVIRID